MGLANVGPAEAQRLELLLGLELRDPAEFERQLTGATQNLQAIEKTLKGQVKQQKKLREDYERLSKLIEKERASRATILKNTTDTAQRQSIIEKSDRVIAGLTQEIQSTTLKRAKVEAQITEYKNKQAEFQNRINVLTAKGAAEENVRLRLLQKGSRGTELGGVEARYFGDVESRMRALTGAVGYVGGGSFERQANIVNEVLASVEAIGLLKVEFPQMVQTAKDWAKTLAGSLNPAMIAGGAAVAAFAVTFYEVFVKDMLSSMSDVEKQVNAYLSAQDAVTDAYDKTSDQIKEEITDREAYLASLKKQLATQQELAGAIDRADDDLTSANAWIVGTARAIEALPIGLSYGLENVDKDIDELKNTIADTEGEIDGLNASLDSAAVAANDAREAEEKLAEERQKFAEATLADTEKSLREAARRQEELRTIMPGDLAGARQGYATDQLVAQTMLPLIDALEQTGDLTSENAEILRNEWTVALNEASATLHYYNTIAADAAHANELQANLLEFLTGKVDDVFEGGRALVGTLEELDEAFDKADAEWVKNWTSFTNAALAHQEQLEEAEEDRILSVQRAIADFELDMANRLADHYTDLARMDQDYYESRADILDKMGDAESDARKEERDELADHLLEMARLAEDHRLKMVDIQRELNMGVQDAVEDRNVSAAIEAIRQGKEEMRAENEQYDLERKRREEDFQLRIDEMEEMRDEKKKDHQQQLQDLKRNHERQRQEKIQDFYRDQARRRQEFNITQQREAEDYQRSLNRLIQHFQEQWGLTNSHYANLNTITEYGMTIIEDTVAQSFANMANAAYANSARQEQLAWEQSRLAAAGLTFFDPPGFADGGDVPAGLPVKVGERGPEWVTFGAPAHVWANGQNPFGPSLTFNTNGYGTGDAAAMEEIFKQRIIPNLIRAIKTRRN